MNNIKGSQNKIDWKHFLKSGDRTFIGYNAAVPNALMDQLIDEQASALNDIEVVHILTLGENRWAQKKYQDTFTLNAFFLGQGTREAVHEGYADYTPCFLSEIPSLFQSFSRESGEKCIMVVFKEVGAAQKNSIVLLLPNQIKIG